MGSHCARWPETVINEISKYEESGGRASVLDKKGAWEYWAQATGSNRFNGRPIDDGTWLPEGETPLRQTVLSRLTIEGAPAARCGLLHCISSGRKTKLSALHRTCCQIWRL